MFYQEVLSISIDCQDVINLATGMNMIAVEPARYNNLKTTDCCDPNPFINPGLSCTNNRITGISWSSLDMTGVLNTSAIPKTTTFINFSNNFLKGTISSLPTNLTTIYLNSNQFLNILPIIPPKTTIFRIQLNKFNGTLPMLPTTVTDFMADNNLFTGSIPRYHDTLGSLELTNNLLSGPFPYLPTSMYTLGIQNVVLTGNIEYWPTSLTTVTLTGNLLTGCIPPFPSGTRYVTLGPGNSFTGNLNLTYPILVDIRNTKIREVNVIDKSQLSVCNLSNTPLLNKVTSYTTCTRTGLYTNATAYTCPTDPLETTVITTLAVTTPILTTVQSTMDAMTSIPIAPITTIETTVATTAIIAVTTMDISNNNTTNFLPSATFTILATTTQDATIKYSYSTAAQTTPSVINDFSYFSSLTDHFSTEDAYLASLRRRIRYSSLSTTTNTKSTLKKTIATTVFITPNNKKSVDYIVIDSSFFKLFGELTITMGIRVGLQLIMLIVISIKLLRLKKSRIVKKQVYSLSVDSRDLRLSAF